MTATDTPPVLDVARIRSWFDSLDSGIAHFDAPGGTQTPRQVGRAVAATLTGPLSNRGTAVLSQRRAEESVTAARQAMADLLGTRPDEIVLGRSATALTFELARCLARRWSAGDELVLTRLEHDANVTPWLRVAEQHGLVVRWLDVDPATGELDLDPLPGLLGERTRLLAVTGASNLIGTMPPVAALAAAAHRVGALVWVDAVHLVPHQRVDLAALGADLLVCSPYKFLGPHCGVLAGRAELLAELEPDRLRVAPSRVPERFEQGTLPYELLAGVTAAVDVLADLVPGEGSRTERLDTGYAALHQHETRLRQRLETELVALDERVVLHSRAARRTPTLLLTVTGRSMQQASAFLAERDVLAPGGHFYAVEPFTRLALADPHPVRLGVAPYTDDTDVDRLLQGLTDWLG